jgi:hypothetical protein
MEILKERNEGKLYLSQKKHLNALVCSNSKPVSTSLVAHFRLSVVLALENEKEEQFMSCVPYSNAIGVSCMLWRALV